MQKPSKSAFGVQSAGQPLPYMPIFVNELGSRTQHLTDEQFGVYVRLLFLMWASPFCQIPYDRSWISRRLRIAVDQIQILDGLEELFEVKTVRGRGKYMTCPHLLMLYDFGRQSREKRAAAGKKRWGIESKENIPELSSSNALKKDHKNNNNIITNKDLFKPDLPVNQHAHKDPPSDVMDEMFEELWFHYPARGANGQTGAAFKGDKKKAKQIFQKILKSEKEDNHAELQQSIIAGCKSYSAFITAADRAGKHLTTWLNAEGWKSDYSIEQSARFIPSTRYDPNIAVSLALADKTRQ